MRNRARALLEIIRDEILPLTESGIAKGNAAGGAAIVRADTLTSAMVGSDDTKDNPILHGEIDAINRFFKLPVHPDPSEMIFLTIYDPCPMCEAAIAVAGFPELWSFLEPDEAREIFGEDIQLSAPDAEPPFARRYIKRELGEAGSDETDELVAEITKRYQAIAANLRSADRPAEHKE